MLPTKKLLNSRVIVLVYSVIFSLLLKLEFTRSREYTTCELLMELTLVHKIEVREAVKWTCLAGNVSEYRTTFVNDQAHGIFGVECNALIGACGQSCETFTDDSIYNDLECGRDQVEFFGDFEYHPVYNQSRCPERLKGILFECFGMKQAEEMLGDTAVLPIAFTPNTTNCATEKCGAINSNDQTLSVMLMTIFNNIRMIISDPCEAVHALNKIHQISLNHIGSWACIIIDTINCKHKQGEHDCKIDCTKIADDYGIATSSCKEIVDVINGSLDVLKNELPKEALHVQNCSNILPELITQRCYVNGTKGLELKPRIEPTSSGADSAFTSTIDLINKELTGEVLQGIEMLEIISDERFDPSTYDPCGYITTKFSSNLTLEQRTAWLCFTHKTINCFRKDREACFIKSCTAVEDEDLASDSDCETYIKNVEEFVKSNANFILETPERPLSPFCRLESFGFVKECVHFYRTHILKETTTAKPTTTTKALEEQAYASIRKNLDIDAILREVNEDDTTASPSPDVNAKGLLHGTLTSELFENLPEITESSPADGVTETTLDASTTPSISTMEILFETTERSTIVHETFQAFLQKPCHLITAFTKYSELTVDQVASWFCFAYDLQWCSSANNTEKCNISCKVVKDNIIETDKKCEERFDELKRVGAKLKSILGTLAEMHVPYCEQSIKAFIMTCRIEESIRSNQTLKDKYSVPSYTRWSNRPTVQQTTVKSAPGNLTTIGTTIQQVTTTSPTSTKNPIEVQTDQPTTSIFINKFVVEESLTSTVPPPQKESSKIPETVTKNVLTTTSIPETTKKITTKTSRTTRTSTTKSATTSPKVFITTESSLPLEALFSKSFSTIDDTSLPTTTEELTTTTREFIESTPPLPVVNPFETPEALNILFDLPDDELTDTTAGESEISNTINRINMCDITNKFSVPTADMIRIFCAVYENIWCGILNDECPLNCFMLGLIESEVCDKTMELVNETSMEWMDIFKEKDLSYVPGCTTWSKMVINSCEQKKEAQLKLIETIDSIGVCDVFDTFASKNFVKQFCTIYENAWCQMNNKSCELNCESFDPLSDPKKCNDTLKIVETTTKKWMKIFTSQQLSYIPDCPIWSELVIEKCPNKVIPIEDHQEKTLETVSSLNSCEILQNFTVSDSEFTKYFCSIYDLTWCQTSSKNPENCSISCDFFSLSDDLELCNSTLDVVLEITGKWQQIFKEQKLSFIPDCALWSKKVIDRCTDQQQTTSQSPELQSSTTSQHSEDTTILSSDRQLSTTFVLETSNEQISKDREEQLQSTVDNINACYIVQDFSIPHSDFANVFCTIYDYSWCILNKDSDCSLACKPFDNNKADDSESCRNTVQVVNDTSKEWISMFKQHKLTHVPDCRVWSKKVLEKCIRKENEKDLAVQRTDVEPVRATTASLYQLSSVLKDRLCASLQQFHDLNFKIEEERSGWYCFTINIFKCVLGNDKGNGCPIDCSTADSEMIRSNRGCRRRYHILLSKAKAAKELSNESLYNEIQDIRCEDSEKVLEYCNSKDEEAVIEVNRPVTVRTKSTMSPLLSTIPVRSETVETSSLASRAQSKLTTTSTPPKTTTTFSTTTIKSKTEVPTTTGLPLVTEVSTVIASKEACGFYPLVTNEMQVSSTVGATYVCHMYGYIECVALGGNSCYLSCFDIDNQLARGSRICSRLLEMAQSDKMEFLTTFNVVPKSKDCVADVKQVLDPCSFETFETTTELVRPAFEKHLICDLQNQFRHIINDDPKTIVAYTCFLLDYMVCTSLNSKCTLNCDTVEEELVKGAETCYKLLEFIEADRHVFSNIAQNLTEITNQCSSILAPVLSECPKITAAQNSSSAKQTDNSSSLKLALQRTIEPPRDEVPDNKSPEGQNVCSIITSVRERLQIDPDPYRTISYFCFIQDYLVCTLKTEKCWLNCDTVHDSRIKGTTECKRVLQLIEKMKPEFAYLASSESDSKTCRKDLTETLRNCSFPGLEVPETTTKALSTTSGTTVSTTTLSTKPLAATTKLPLLVGERIQISDKSALNQNFSPITINQDPNSQSSDFNDFLTIAVAHSRSMAEAKFQIGLNKVEIKDFVITPDNDKGHFDVTFRLGASHVDEDKSPESSTEDNHR